MKLVVAAVGRLRVPWFRDGCAEYAQRISRHFPLDVVEVRDVHRKGGDVDRWRRAEADALRSACPRGAFTVVLDEGGRQWTSPELAEFIREHRDTGTPSMAFLIGGPDGHDPALRREARRTWSLGKLTLPHEMARMVLLEQIYRAGMILSGAPYHR